MKIILLRHEERYFDIGFFSSLTDNGIIRANTSLITELSYIKIDCIFSSPFLRTLQTIYPYSKKKNKKVKIEYGLYEYIHNPYFLLFQWYHTTNDIEDVDLKSIINKNYKSIVNKDDFSILENENNLEKRIKKFFDYLLKDYKNKTVLLVTHKGVINKIKDMYIKKTDMDEDFDTGMLLVHTIN